MQNLKSKYEQKEMKVSDGLWDRLEEKLDRVPAKKKKPKVFWWRFVAVIILILNFGGISWMTDIKNKVKETPEFKFPRIENQISSVRQQSENTNEIQKSVSTDNAEIDNQRLAVENKDSSTPLRMTKGTKKESQVSEKELSIKNEESKVIPQSEEKLAQNELPKIKEKPKYVSSSDLLFGVEIDKAKTETPKSAMGINVSKPKNDSDFPNPKRIKLFGITLYDKDSITTKYRNSFSFETTDGWKFKFKKRVKSPKYYINTSTLTVSYAFANLTKDKGSFNPFENDSEMRIGNSHSVEVQFRKDKQLGSFTSPWILRYGLAYRTDTYMPKRPQVFVQDNSELFLDDFQQGTLKRSKLRNVYLTLPVEFQLYLNPKYTEYDGKQYLDVRKKMWKVGVGAYAGVNTRSIVKVKYYNENGNFKKYDYTLDDGVNAFLFGGKFSFGYGGVNLFIKKDFTPIFNDKANIPNRNGIQVGIEIANIDF